MASEEGSVIVCHTMDELDAQLAKADESGKLVIIDFRTAWCPGCKFMAPVFAACAKEYPAAVFLEVDVEEVEEVGKIYEIRSIPTFTTGVCGFAEC